jgi:hypothetical protein
MERTVDFREQSKEAVQKVWAASNFVNFVRTPIQKIYSILKRYV